MNFCPRKNIHLYMCQLLDQLRQLLEGKYYKHLYQPEILFCPPGGHKIQSGIICNLLLSTMDARVSIKIQVPDQHVVLRNILELFFSFVQFISLQTVQLYYITDGECNYMHSDKYVICGQISAVLITINAPIDLTAPCIIFSGGFFSL